MDAIRRSGRAATISAATTLRPISRPPSTARPSPTTIPIEQWLAEGEKTAPQRANELARRWLESYEAPAISIRRSTRR
jgi:trimethylamine:corrinoid methyltransferase-like protein